MEVEVRRIELPSENRPSLNSLSAPTSPRAAKEWADLFFTSAPASPSRAAAVFGDLSSSSRSYATPPPDEDLDDFAFDFNGGASPLPADVLFDHGVIRPLKLPPRLQSLPPPPVFSPKSTARSGFSPSPRRSPAPELDPFAAAIQVTTRGRERDVPKVKHRAARSLSPLRRLFDSHVSPAAQQKSGSGKWRLRDLLLFRSASEGSEKDRARKYMISREERGPSFRSTEGSARRSGGSAHERHYAANRAAAEELRKKTTLPYRQSLFGFLSFNPAITVLTKGFTSSRGRQE